jgi:two-component system chemotaxis response regulator CheB
MIAEMIADEPGFEVVGIARDGVDALTQIERLDPDIVTLDLSMPRLDGMQVLQHVMSSTPRPIVVLSAGGPEFGDATLRALELGAVEFVSKPSGAVSLDLPAIRAQLISALRAAASADVSKMCTSSMDTSGTSLASQPVSTPHSAATHTNAVFAVAAGESKPRATDRRSLSLATRVVVIAASTGGPRALSEVIPALPADLDAAVLVAQHMPREFTSHLAERLNQMSQVTVAEAVDGEPLMNGHVYIAPGAMHMRVVPLPIAAARLPAVRRSNRSPSGSAVTIARIALDTHTGGTSLAPSANLLFTSAANAYGPSVTAVVLTGMGRDGCDGVRDVRAAGGRAIAQDQATSVMYSMPHAASFDAGAELVLPISSIPNAIVTEVARRDLHVA